ncbi:MAG: N-acetylmuramoyl-L-alanine amidase [Flammeovirgaceae bacterium]|nr:N-acetylmuramoyl-L-alanine amidase [Flammeovirgaceae bacterium]
MLLKKILAVTFSLALLPMACIQLLLKTLAQKPLSYEEKIRWLVRNEEVKSYFRIADDGIEMFASLDDKKVGKIECKVYHDEIDDFLAILKRLPEDSLESFYRQKGTEKLKKIRENWEKTLLPSKTIGISKNARRLENIRIALDPGHVGGDMKTAILEGRYVIMAFPNGDTVQFNEGNLNLATAYLLKEKLEKEGANVMITKYKKGHSAFDKSYDDWLKEDFLRSLEEERAKNNIDAALYQTLKTTQDKAYIYERFFKYLDFRERARKINAFQPHLTIVIHYNIDAPNWERRNGNVYQPSGINYSMVFLPGSFMKKELQETRDRLEFLRLLLSDDLQASLALCQRVQKRFVEDLNVPPVANDERLNYLKRGCIYTGIPGIYARNLALTRLVHSPLCYGETLCQDDEQEARWLAIEEIPAGELKTSPRVAQTAEAYFNAILDYVEHFHPR